MTPPPELLALLQAYVSCTGLQITLSYERQRVLSDLHQRGISPEDVRAICTELQRLIRSGAKGYADSSLDFRNCLGDPDRTEERALRLRQAAQRKQKRLNPVQVERTVAEGVVVRMLDNPEPKEPQVINLKAALSDLASQIKSA